MGKIGLGGVVVLELIFFFILMPWHRVHDPVPANGEQPSIIRTWWELGQPTRPTKVAQVAVQQQTAASAVPSASASAPVAPKATPKVQGAKAAVTAKPVSRPAPQPQVQALPQQDSQYRDLSKEFQSAFSRH